jgi:nucleoside phosphorylase
VRIIHTGVGADAARVTLEQALCEVEELPDRVIVSGFAGALVPGLEIAEIVIGEGIQSGGRRATFAQADVVLATAAEKRAFHERTGAEVVDMESAEIREVCAAAGVPAMPLRAISDGANDDLGLPPDLLENLAAHPIRATPHLAVMLLTNAARRKAFLTLLRNCRRAQLALADALEKEVRFSSRMAT